jgi:hypothetical protein
MSWSAFPPSHIIPLGTYSNDSLITGYFAGSGTRSDGYLIAHHASSAVASTRRQPVYLHHLSQTQETRDLPHLYSLGSAYAGTDHRGFWPESLGRQLPASLPEASRTPAPVNSIVHVPADRRQIMAQIARARGRSEVDLWAEAADAWLASHSYDDEPLPPAPSAALAIPTNNRSWDMIDDLLTSSRRPSSIPGTDTKDYRERAA